MATTAPFDLSCCWKTARSLPAGASTAGEAADLIEERFRGPDLTPELLDLVRDRYWTQERWRWFADGEKKALVAKGKGLLTLLRKDLAAGWKVLLSVRDDFLPASVVARFAAPKKAAILAGPVVEFFEPVYEVEDYLRFIEDLEAVRRASPSLPSPAAAAEALFQVNRGLLGHPGYAPCPDCRNLPIFRDAADSLCREENLWPRIGREVLPLPLRFRFARDFREYVEGLEALRTLPHCRYVGVSFPRVRALWQVVRAASASADVTILLLGPPGSGKELLAHLAHAVSPSRRRSRFVPVSAGNLSESLAESELFGHEKGAYTGSVKARKGAFRRADGGTLFLDEVGDLPAGVQVKLLRVLQEREIQPLGSDEDPVPVNVRLVAATNRDIQKDARDGAFRMDLLWRLDCEVVRVPALRRGDPDLPLLADGVLRRLGKKEKREAALSGEALGILMGREWPGNIRELENTLERALHRSRCGNIRETDVLAAIASSVAAGSPPRPAPASPGVTYPVEGCRIGSEVTSAWRVTEATPPLGHTPSFSSPEAPPSSRGLLPSPEAIRALYGRDAHAKVPPDQLARTVANYKRSLILAMARDGSRRRSIGEIARLLGSTQASLTKFLGDDLLERVGRRVYVRDAAGTDRSRP